MKPKLTQDEQKWWDTYAGEALSALAVVQYYTPQAAAKICAELADAMIEERRRRYSERIHDNE